MATEIPMIAIHGVGNHDPGKIKAALEERVRDFDGISMRPHEFNWAHFVEHNMDQEKKQGKVQPIRAIQRLEMTSFDTQAAGLAGLKAYDKGIDPGIVRLQLVFCHVLRYVIAAFLTLFVALPAVVLLVFLPSALVQTNSALPKGVFSWYAANLVPLFLTTIAAISTTVVAIGALRSAMQWTLVPFRASIVAVGLILLNPLLIVLSIPFTLPWTKLAFFVLALSLFGLFAFFLTWILPAAGPIYSIWDEYWLVPYFAFVAVSVIILQLLHSRFGADWFVGPIKVVLDIFRYLGNPPYRKDILEKLDAFVVDKSSGSASLVVVAHSLGSVIALDYLLNECKPASDRDVWLLTMGSPYRRFFLSLFPRLLFYRKTSTTATVIAKKFRSFHWLNIYRPWDPIGKSLGLCKALAGLDVDTEQWRRPNGHGNYWKDPVVAEWVSRVWKSVPVPVERMPEASEPVIPDRVRLFSPPWSLLKPVSTAFFGLAVLWMIYSIFQQDSEIAEMQKRIQEHGVHLTNVFAAHQQIPDAAPNLSAHQFDFLSGTASDIPSVQLSPWLPQSRAQRLFDYRKLRDHIRANCKLEKDDKWYTIEEQIRCVGKEPIELWYIPGGARPELYLPKFQARFYFRDVIDWTVYPLVLILIVSAVGYFFSLMTSGLFSILVGRGVAAEFGEDQAST